MVLILLQVLIIIISTLLYNFLARGEVYLKLDSVMVLKIFIALLLGIITELNNPKLYQKKFKYVFASPIKFIFLFVCISLVIDLLIGSVLPGVYFITTVMLLLVNGVFIMILLYKKNNNKYEEEIQKYEQKNLQFDENLHLTKISKNIITDLIYFTKEILFEIDTTLNDTGTCKIGILNNHNSLNSNSYDIIILDSLINSLNDINAKLNEIYSNLKNGGLLILCYEDLKDFEAKYFMTGNKLLKIIKNFYYYLFKRLLPKLPLLNKLLKFLNKYKVLSKAEIWGRLAYNGFDVHAEFKEAGLTFLVSRKIFEQSKNPNPSFYPLIRLNRVGLYGKIIKIHKIRSMYPYSEFIQKKVFENNKLNNIGKFEEDFRITKPGKFFRKYWIDELPQFYDWLRGEIKLVGIRAMSQHFFSLYPDDYKELYLQIKPGIISPIFDEKTAGFDEIVKIEKKYLELYKKNPMLTDITYFFVTIKHILSGVRSK